MYYATHCPSGTKLWLTRRDEPAIFESLGQMMKQIVANLGERRPVAVFHADCLARGRFLFNRVLKEEIVSAMQSPLFAHGEIPWLGMYGFGEFARLGGRNEFHNYTTALAVIARR
jgi:small ligand-binding sensory domain FIST